MTLTSSNQLRIRKFVPRLRYRAKRRLESVNPDNKDDTPVSEPKCNIWRCRGSFWPIRTHKMNHHSNTKRIHRTYGVSPTRPPCRWILSKFLVSLARHSGFVPRSQRSRRMLLNHLAQDHRCRNHSKNGIYRRSIISKIPFRVSMLAPCQTFPTYSMVLFHHLGYQNPRSLLLLGRLT